MARPYLIPEKLAVCPICGKRLRLEDISGWVEQEPGDWVPDEFQIECVTEPPINSKKWDDWFNGHYQHPYIDWLPITVKVEAWLAKNYHMVEVDGNWKLVKREKPNARLPTTPRTTERATQRVRAGGTVSPSPLSRAHSSASPEAALLR